MYATVSMIYICCGFLSFFSRKRCYSKSPLRTRNLASNPQKLWPYTRPNDKDDKKKRISVKSWDDLTIQLTRQSSKLFDHEKLLKPNRWQPMIPEYFWVIIDWSSIGRYQSMPIN